MAGTAWASRRERNMTRSSAVSMLLAGVVIAGAGWAQADEELVVFDWAGYEDPNFFQAYIEEHGGPPTFAFFGGR